MDSTKPDLGILIVISNFEFISHSLATLNSCLSFAAICLYAQNFPSTIILYLLLNNYVIVWYYVILYIQLASLVWYWLKCGVDDFVIQHLMLMVCYSSFAFDFPACCEESKMGRRILNDALRAVVNAERRSKSTVELQPISTVMSSFLEIMKDRGYIKNFYVYDPHRVGRITVELQGRVTDCRALTYRQDIKAKEIEAYRLRNLPTRQWGYVVITTPDGILDHEEAISRNVGGQVLGYFH